MIHTTSLRYTYPAGQTLQYPDISVEQGSSLVIIGKSGCGKTTLLHLLGGLLKPDQGSVFIRGKDISSFSNKDLDLFRGQHIGFIFQRSLFIQSLSVKDNILLAPYLSQKKASVSSLNALSENLGIAHLLKKLPSQLSQGEQQRVSIARAIIHQPNLVLADEPTSSLDDENTETVSGLLTNLCKQHKAALIIVTHDVRLKQLIPNQITLL